MTETKTKRGPGRPKGATKARMQRRARYQKKLKADKEKLKQEQAVLEGEVMPAEVVKRPVGKPKGHPKTGGRVKGVETLDKRTLREQVTRVVDMKAKSISVWIDEIYRNQGPDKALEKVIALMEYALPKLNRTEWTGANGGPVEHEVSIVISPVKPIE